MENENFRVIVTAKDIVISFAPKSRKEIQDRLQFLFMGLTTPETITYDENGLITNAEFNTKVIVALIQNQTLDAVIFPLSDYKKYIEVQ